MVRQTSALARPLYADILILGQYAFNCNGQAASIRRSSVETQLLAAMGWNPRFSTAASNTVWQVNCTNGTIASTGQVVIAATSVTGPLGALLGTPSRGATFSQVPAPGDVVEITGICSEDFTVRTSGLMLTNREGPEGSAADVQDADGVQGQIEIAGAQRIVLSGLLLGNFTTSFSFAAASDLALFFVHDDATVALLHSDVNNSPSYGALIRRGAQATLFDDRFFFNGFGNCVVNGINLCAPGIAVLTNAKAVFGADDGSLPVLVQGSGGDGVVASVGSSVIFHAAHLTLNGNRQLFVEGASSARLSGSAVTVDMSFVDPQLGTQACKTTQGSPCNTAIAATGASMLRIENGASVSALDSGSPVGAIALSQGSALLAQGATIQALATAAATVAGSDNSVIALAGGNKICSGSCDGSTSGFGVMVDHVSTLIQVAPAEFGYAAAQDMLFGNASAQLQSTIDLGLGTVGVSGPPSLAWTTSSVAGGGVFVSQNSSFRLEGGVTIAGPGGLKLSQGSNGFFNVVNGGANSVAGGVTCPFTNIPGAHVAGPAAVSPALTLSSDFFNTPPNACLPF